MKLIIAVALLAVASAELLPVALPPAILPADGDQYEAAEIPEAVPISWTANIVRERLDRVRGDEAPVEPIVIVDDKPADEKIQVVEGLQQPSWPVRVIPNRPYARPGKVFDNPMWR